MGGGVGARRGHPKATIEHVRGGTRRKGRRGRRGRPAARNTRGGRRSPTWEQASRSRQEERGRDPKVPGAKAGLRGAHGETNVRKGGDEATPGLGGSLAAFSRTTERSAARKKNPHKSCRVPPHAAHAARAAARGAPSPCPHSENGVAEPRWLTRGAAAASLVGARQARAEDAPAAPAEICRAPGPTPRADFATPAADTRGEGEGGPLSRAFQPSARVQQRPGRVVLRPRQAHDVGGAAQDLQQGL